MKENDKSSFIIRPLKSSDAKDLFEFLKDIDKKTKNYFHPHSFDYDTIKKICESKKDYYYVLLINDRIIGYSFLRLFGYEIPSFGIIIRRNYTNKGYGTVLTEWTVNKAKELGFKKVILKTYKKNIAARKVYKKIGFSIIGETEDKKQYRMELKL